MKLLMLSLLMFLVSCVNSSPQFKAGDCIRSLGAGGIRFFSIKEVTKIYYIVTIITDLGYKKTETEALSLNHQFLDGYLESTKIKCPEVE